jgi:hypothetical protein
MPNNQYEYPYDINTVLEPWRAKLEPDFENVVRLLQDRDTNLESMLGTGRWIGYVPVVTVGSGTAPTFGSGVVQGYYTRFGRTVLGTIIIQAGAGAAPGSVPAEGWRFSLPTPRENPNLNIINPINIGGGYILDSSTGEVRTVAINVPSFSDSNVFTVQFTGASPNTFLSNSVPWALATGDAYSFHFMYDGAAPI